MYAICSTLQMAKRFLINLFALAFFPLRVQTNETRAVWMHMIDNWLAATVRRCVSDLGWLPSPTNSSNKSKLLRYLPKPLSMVLPSSACHKMMADSSIMMIIHTQVPSSPLSSRDFLVTSKQSFGSSSPLYCTTRLWV